MQSNLSKLVRVGALAAVVGGALLFVADAWGLVEMLAVGSPESYSQYVATPIYGVQMGIVLSGVILLVVGLVGLYARQVEEAGTLGLVGFLAALVGTVMMVGVFWLEFFVNPSLAREVPAYLDSNPGGIVMVGFMLSAIALVAGWALFGVATFRARIFPRAASVALTLGALLFLVPVVGNPVLLDLAVIWLGFSALRENENAASAKPIRTRARPQVR